MAYTSPVMRRIVPLLVGLPVLVLAFAVSTLATGAVRVPDRVYALEEVYAGLRERPRDWAGRVVFLRATVVGDVSYRLCPVDQRTILPGHPPRCPDIGWIYLGPTTWQPKGVGPDGFVVNAGWTTRPPRTLSASVVSTPLMPVQEIPVQIRTPFLRWHVPRQPLPAVFYHLPLVGSLLPRAPALGEPVKVWRVRLLTPRACRALHQTACPDGVSLDY